VKWSNGMDGVTQYPGQVTSAVCVKTKTSLIEFAAVLYGTTREERVSGQGQKEERTIGCYQQHITVFRLISSYRYYRVETTQQSPSSAQ
jgi:hypothetical protein